MRAEARRLPALVFGNTLRPSGSWPSEDPHHEELVARDPVSRQPGTGLRQFRAVPPIEFNSLLLLSASSLDDGVSGVPCRPGCGSIAGVSWYSREAGVARKWICHTAGSPTVGDA